MHSKRPIQNDPLIRVVSQVLSEAIEKPQIKEMTVRSIQTGRNPGHFIDFEEWPAHKNMQISRSIHEKHGFPKPGEKIKVHFKNKSKASWEKDKPDEQYIFNIERHEKHLHEEIVSEAVIPSKTIVSDNTDYGFFGSVRSNYGTSTREAAHLFDAAGKVLIKAGVAKDGEEARMALDSRDGRHFADQISYLTSSDPDAKEIEAALEKTLAKYPYFKKEFGIAIKQTKAENQTG